MVKLRLVEATDTQAHPATLGELAGEHSDLETIDRSLADKIGKRVVFLCAHKLYLFGGEGDETAEVVDGVGGGVGVIYNGLCRPQLTRRFNPVESSLAVVSGESIAVARFDVCISDDAIEESKRLIDSYGESIGALYSQIGVELDQAVQLLDVRNALVDNEPTQLRPKLHIVRTD